MKVRVFAVSLFLTLLLIAGGALAKTPDGQPPSVETVCDPLHAPGITPGLFGLCNAYCEAQDCDLYPDNDLPRSCENLLRNYNRKRRSGDPEMPCESSCPCWGPGELSSVNNLEPFSCSVNGAGGVEQVVYNDDGSIVVFQFSTELCTYQDENTEVDYFFSPPEDNDVRSACAADMEQLMLDCNNS